MQQMQGTFKLVYRGMEGYDLLFERFSGFGNAEGRRAVPNVETAYGVLDRVLGRPLTPGEKTTLALGNGMVASFNSDNYTTYF